MLPELMNTSRAQVNRILNAKGNVTIETLQRAVALAHDPEKLQTFQSRSYAESKRIELVSVQPYRTTLQ